MAGRSAVPTYGDGASSHAPPVTTAPQTHYSDDLGETCGGRGQGVRSSGMMLGMVVKRNMLATIVGAGLVIGLAGCSGATAPQAVTQAPTPVSSEAAYLAALHPLGLDGTDAQSISLARTICADLDASQPMSDLIASIVNSGAMNDADTRTVIRAAIVNYCPSHKGIAPAA